MIGSSWYKVSIQGIGTRMARGNDGWHARQNAIVQFSHLESDPSKFSKGLATC